MSPQTDFLAHYRHPVAFFALATAIPWALWGAAAWISFQPLTLGSQVAVLVFCLVGLLAPLMVTAGFAHRDPALRHDMVRRLTNFRGIRWHWYLTAATLLFASILLATAVSLLFGYPLEQFQVRNALTFGSSIFPVWIALVVAPVVEELAWHSYGTDALRSRMSLWWASIVFGVIWMLWHLPLAFVQGYTYQNEVVQIGVIESVNYLVSVFPFMLIMNWIYYRTGRNIALTIVFHLSANLANEVFNTEPRTKVIQTALLLIFCAVLLVRERALFFSSPRRGWNHDAGRAADQDPHPGSCHDLAGPARDGVVLDAPAGGHPGSGSDGHLLPRT